MSTVAVLDRKELHQAFTRMLPIVPARGSKTVPIRLTLTPAGGVGVVTVEGCGQECSIVTGIAGTLTGDVATFDLKAHPFLELLAGGCDANARLELNGDGVLRYESGRVKAELLPAGKDAERVADVEGVTVPLTPHLRTAILRAASVASDDSSRPILETILFDRGTVVATDSYRLAATSGLRPFGSSPVVVPAASLAKAVRQAGQPAELVLAPHAVAVVGADGTTTVIPRPDVHGDLFPKWRGLVPHRGEGQIIAFDRKRAVEALAAFTGFNQEPVQLTQEEYGGNWQPLILSNRPGMRREIPVRSGCLFGPVAFDPRFLKHALGSLTGPVARMQVRDHVKPVAITEGMHLHLLMPMVVG